MTDRTDPGDRLREVLAARLKAHIVGLPRDELPLGLETVEVAREALRPLIAELWDDVEGFLARLAVEVETHRGPEGLVDADALCRAMLDWDPGDEDEEVTR